MAPQYKQKYCSKWETDEELKEWVRAVPGEPFQAQCKYCKQILTTRKKDLLDHAKRKKHVDAMRTLGVSTTKEIKEFFQPTISSEQKKVDLKLATFIAEHSSIKTVDHLGELLKSIEGVNKDCNGSFKDLKLHRTKCTALITEVLAPSFHEELLEDIEASDAWFSLVLDECTDITDNKWLGMIIRFYSVKKSEVVDTLYRLFPLSGADAESLANAILEALETDGLDVKKLIGIGVDGASVNVGSNHSVATLLKEKVPHLVVVRCICHSLHLAASKASECLPRQLDFIVRETYKWFCHSTKRKEKYKDLYSTITGINPLKFVRPCDTRWLSVREAVSRIIDQWEELKLFFRLAKDQERDYTAEQLYTLYRDPVNKLYMMYLRNMLVDITGVNKLFQSESADQTKLFASLFTYYMSLLKMIVVPSQLDKVSEESMFNFSFEKFTMPTAGMYFGYEFSLEVAKLSLSSEQLNDIKRRCKEFTVQLAKEVRSRLPDNVGVLLQLSTLHPNNAVKKVKCSIVPLAAQFVAVCENVDKCQREWDRLPLVSEVSTEEFIKQTPVAFWASVDKLTDAAGEKQFPKLCKLALTLLSLPFSNATVERMFSQLSNVKTKLRNSLQLKTVESILMVRYGLKFRGENCVDFNPSKEMLMKFHSDAMYGTKTKEATGHERSEEEVWEIFVGSSDIL